MLREDVHHNENSSNDENDGDGQVKIRGRLGLPAAEIMRWFVVGSWLVVQLYLQTHYVALTAYRADTDRLDLRLAKTEALLIALDKGMTGIATQDRQLLDQARRIDKLASEMERLNQLVAEMRGRLTRDPM